MYTCTVHPITEKQVGAEIYLLIAIGEQKSVLAKQCHMLFVTGDENAKGQKCDTMTNA